MTTFGTDRSRHNAVLTSSQGSGLGFHTNKLTDGDHWYEDATYKANTDRAKGYGIQILGSYHVLWGNKSLSSQADWWVQRARALTPYCDTYPYIWQPDCESFGYNGLPTIDQINSFGDMVCARAGVPAERFTPYAPSWVYGSALEGLRYSNYWGSNYGSNPATDYVSAYPGDNSPRWTSAAIAMLILQYGSTTDIGDANAFRGSLQQLMTAIKATGGNMPDYGQLTWEFLENGTRSGVHDGKVTTLTPQELVLPDTGYSSTPNNLAGVTWGTVRQDAQRARQNTTKLLAAVADLDSKLDHIGTPTVADLTEAIKNALLDPNVQEALKAIFSDIKLTGTFKTD